MQRLFRFSAQFISIALMLMLPSFVVGVILEILALSALSTIFMITGSYLFMAALVLLPVVGITGILTLMDRGYLMLDDSARDVRKRKLKDEMFIPFYEQTYQQPPARLLQQNIPDNDEQPRTLHELLTYKRNKQSRS
ncbi:MAG: hypothetical protein ACPG7F_11715 [Aggregatilineales bacterium]